LGPAGFRQLVCTKIIYAQSFSSKEALMWTTEHSTETTAAPQALWRVWSDVERWPDWNADPEGAELSGPFAAGSTITMYQRDGDTIELRIAEASEPEGFMDQSDLGQMVVRTIHCLKPLGSGRFRVIYRMEISGPEADRLGPQIGAAFSADFPQVLAALVERAEH
jgi:Polyketide cyclase / dehydrase and lipid transport